MRVLNVMSGIGLGGPKSVFISYHNLFEKMKIDNIPVLRKGSRLAKILNSEKTVFLDYSRHLPIRFQKSRILAIRQLVDEKKPDAIIVHKTLDALIWRYACPEAIIILVRHGFKMKHLEYASHIIAVSPSVYDAVKRNGFNNVTLINNFLKSDVSEHSIVSNKVIKISSLGVFTGRKGFKDLLLSFSYNDIILIKHKLFLNIWGEGILKPFLHFLRIISPCKDIIKISKWVDDPIPILKDTDIVVVPSREETFCMVVIEALSQGALVISTKCKGPEAILEDQKTGILVPVKDPEALAKAINDAVINIDKYKAIREAGRKMVKEYYSQEAVAQEFLNLFKNIINK